MFDFLKKEKRLIKLLNHMKNNNKALYELRNNWVYVTLRPIPAYITDKEDNFHEIVIDAFSIIRPTYYFDQKSMYVGFCTANNVSSAPFITYISYVEQFMFKRYQEDEIIIQEDLLDKYAIQTIPMLVKASDKSFEFDTCNNALEFKRTSYNNLFFILSAVFISCSTMFYYDAAKSMFPGISDVMKQTLNALREDVKDDSEKRKLTEKALNYMQEVYNTLIGMDALKEITYKNLLTIVEEKRREREIREQQIVQANKEKELKVSSLMNQIDARRELLKDFNRPITEAAELFKEKEGIQ